MAIGKKSFIVYSDWKSIFDELPNEDAGALIKHIFAYVNDENPESDSVLIRAVFANIKTILKRDLEKWDSQLQQRIDAGKRSAELRLSTKSNERSIFVDETLRNPTDNVSVIVNDSVSVSVKEKKKRKTTVFIPPIIEDIKKYFVDHGYPEKLAIRFFESYSVADWIDTKGNKVLNWKQKALNVWFRDENKDKTAIPQVKNTRVAS